MRQQYQDDYDDVFDEDGLLKDGRRMRTSMFAMDSTQRSIARHVTDAFGDSSDAAINRPGPRYASGVTNDTDRGHSRAELYDFADAEMAAQWRGGLQVGDTVVLNGQRYTVDERGSDRRTRLQIDRQSAEDAKDAAYASYQYDLQRAWMASDAEGVQNHPDRLTRDYSNPVSLQEQHDAEMADVYSVYKSELENAWRTA